ENYHRLNSDGNDDSRIDEHVTLGSERRDASKRSKSICPIAVGKTTEDLFGLMIDCCIIAPLVTPGNLRTHSFKYWTGEAGPWGCLRIAFR
ncbi:MAG: hypothetical protein ACO3L6_09210, partial [Dehalococcoidia bacterium]